jgi:hypothetical protein
MLKNIRPSLDETARGQDILSSFSIGPEDTAVLDHLSEALPQVREGKHLYVPLVLDKDVTGQDILVQIEKTDFNPFLQDVVRALRRK